MAKSSIDEQIQHLDLLLRSTHATAISILGCFLSTICLVLALELSKHLYGKESLQGKSTFKLVTVLLIASIFVAIIGAGLSAWLVINAAAQYKRSQAKTVIECKELGDFTSRIKDVEPGTKAYLDGPYGVFTIDRYWDSAGFVFIAGGIGITPMMSMLLTAADRRDDRPFLLIYANKNWESITFREELDALTERIDLRLIHVLREPPEDWSGETGYVDRELLERYISIHRGSRQYFICAAPVMMEQVEAALHDLEVPVTHVHMEHFNLV